ncbi:unnamed protein product [Adineta steineri]|uniref:Uncharacterized protein n=1 Tax=Adineta steineri TaxID=433720 RepID=A0A820IIC6_9BILA|nr:unnamed protein product [Adineta steineri]
MSCLFPAVYSMNTNLTQCIKHTPFKVVSEQELRLNMTLWQSLADQGIEDEDALPASILKQLEETDTMIYIDK